MEGIDINTIAQMAPAVVVLLWIIYRQDMRIDRLEKACIEFKQQQERAKETEEQSRVP